MNVSPIARTQRNRPYVLLLCATLFLLGAGAATIYAIDSRLYGTIQASIPQASTSTERTEPGIKSGQSTQSLNSAVLNSTVLNSAGDVKSMTAQTLDGKTIHPLVNDEAKVVVFIFIRTDCPIANRYAPEIRRLYSKFASQGIFSQGIAFRLVYAEPSDTADAIREHLKAYQYSCDALRDSSHVLVRHFGVTVTPEVVVYIPKKNVTAYRGRIDNLYADFGRARPEPTTHELEDALGAVLSNRPVSVRETKAIGCTINDLL